MKPPDIFDNSSGRDVWVSGTVVIDGVLHEVKNKYIKCDPSLNSRAWGITEQDSICSKCFPPENIKKEFIQLSLF